MRARPQGRSAITDESHSARQLREQNGRGALEHGSPLSERRTPTNAQITRLPGEAKSSNAVGVPVACNPPEPDFLVRSRLRPNEVMKTAEEFVALRKRHLYQPATDRWGYSVAKRKEPLANPYKVSE